MTTRSLLVLLFAGATAVTAPALAETYKIDPNHTQVRFQYSHFDFTHIVGLLGGIEGEVVYDPANPDKSAVSARIPLDHIDTGVPALNEHLQSDDFFDIGKFPVATFTSTSVEPLGDKHLKVTGDLTVHGVTKPVTLDVQLNRIGVHPASGTQAVGFDASTTLTRSDFGVGLYAPNVSDAVQLQITAEARVPKAQ